MIPRLLTIAAAAEATGLSVDRLRRAVHDGEIAHFRGAQPKTKRHREPHHTTSTIYLVESSLVAWIQSQITPAQPKVATAAKVVLDADDELPHIPARERLFA